MVSDFAESVILSVTCSVLTLLLSCIKGTHVRDGLHIWPMGPVNNQELHFYHVRS